MVFANQQSIHRHFGIIMILSPTSKMLVHVIYQLLSTVLNYQPPVFFTISIIDKCLNFM